MSMKQFLSKACIFTIPLLLFFLGIEYSLRIIPNVYTFKRSLLEADYAGIKTLIIGNSVANHGIDPSYMADSTLNFAFGGQSPRFNCALANRYIDRLPHLENIIVGISYQSFWWDEYGNGDGKVHDDLLVYYRLYLDMSFDNDWRHYSEFLSTGDLAFKKWIKHYISGKSTMQCDSLGFDHEKEGKNEKKDDNWKRKVGNSAKKHTMCHYKRAATIYNQNIERFDELAQKCAERNVELYLVVPPVTEAYSSNADTTQLNRMYAALHTIADKRQHVHLLDYFKHPDFTNNDFHDGNHLKASTGARKFSKLLQHDIFE